MSTCKRLDLQALRSQPSMPKNLPDHCSLGVNRMWTKRNDRGPESECGDFFNICPKMTF